MNKALLCTPLLVLLLLLGSACGGSTSESPKAGPDADVTDVSENDEEMNRAMERARATIEEFVRQLDAPPSPERIVRLKAVFDQGGDTEYIWLRDVVHSDGSFTGTVGNAPVDGSGVHLGDRVTVPLVRVSDWMVIDGKRLVAGGYTVRVLRDRMSPEERKTFDEENDLVVE